MKLKKPHLGPILANLKNMKNTHEGMLLLV